MLEVQGRTAVIVDPLGRARQHQHARVILQQDQIALVYKPCANDPASWA
jgi:hypothetical protein